MSCRRLVILTVQRRRAELASTLDDLIHRLQEVLLSAQLAPPPDSEHAGLCSYTTQLCTSRVGAEACDELVTDVALFEAMLQ